MQFTIEWHEEKGRVKFSSCRLVPISFTWFEKLVIDKAYQTLSEGNIIPLIS